MRTADEDHIAPVALLRDLLLLPPPRALLGACPRVRLARLRQRWQRRLLRGLPGRRRAVRARLPRVAVLLACIMKTMTSLLGHAHTKR